jgi:hypothetical protein
MRRLLQHLKRAGTTAEFEPMASFPEREAIVGLADAQGTAARFLDPATVAPPSHPGAGTEQSHQEAE